MKTIFVVRPHSFVDVITNSSSELFVLRTDKAMDVVIEFIKQKLNTVGDAPSDDINDYIENIYRIEGPKHAELCKFKDLMTGDIVIETFDVNNDRGHYFPDSVRRAMRKKFNIIREEGGR